VDALEREYGWAVASASGSPNTLTLTYLSDLELFFHPSSFQSLSGNSQANSPISLSYVGDEERLSNSKPRALSTTKRFFLQLLRAHLHSIVQCQTPMSSLLKIVSSGWNVALSVSEAVRVLNLSCMTEEIILSDERMAVDTTILLPTLQTKVRARFEIAATPVGNALESNTKIEAKVVYGERYDEAKMSEFLTTFAGGRIGQIDGMGRWAEGVEDLRVRLIRRGRKG
jgi:kinetochore protein Spc7/SPC105